MDKDKKSIKINIFGSCVSRDVLEYQEGEPVVKRPCYIARQSIVSAVSKPVAIDEERLQIASVFQKRMVLHDFRKEAFDELRKNPGDAIVIDLVDERFPLAKLRNAYVTYSQELKVSRYLKIPVLKHKRRRLHVNKKAGRRLITWSVDGVELDKYVEEFCQKISSIYRPEQIILHEVYLCDKYVNKKGETCFFPKKHIRNNAKVNQLYEYMYQKMYEYLPKINRINISRDYLADEAHKWGLAPMHYQKEYYENVMIKIKEICSCE